VGVLGNKGLSVSERSPAWERRGDDVGCNFGVLQASKASNFRMAILMSSLFKISEGWPKFSEASLHRSSKLDTITNNRFAASDLGLKIGIRSQLTDEASIFKE
jgi:hypothetical protein